ncbi:MAG: 30S ribosomal protein S9 [Patescibacteria group bacterium]
MVKKQSEEKSSIRQLADKEHKTAGGRYVEAVGGRKTAVARVRITPGGSHFVVNEKSLKDYFPLGRLSNVARQPIDDLKLEGKFSVSAQVRGGGVMAQAEAVRHGLARALTIVEPEFKKRLRQLGFLTRDSRMVERKKYGLKKARRAPQWAKR